MTQTVLSIRFSQILGHWLHDPKIVSLMSRFTFFVSCSTSVSLGQYIKSSLKIITADEANKENLVWNETQLPCSYSRTGRSTGTAYRAISISNLDIAQPVNHSMGMIVKHTGPISIPHPSDKSSKVHFVGDELVGEVVHFLKKEKKNRKVPDSPDVTCIKLTCSMMGLLEGTNARIPVECVCKVVTLGSV